jgi:hypothetical protein
MIYCPVCEPEKAHFLLQPLVCADCLRTCAGCGCTDNNACIDPETGEPCAWAEGVDIDICTRCAAIALRMAEADEADVAQRIDEPLVQLYSEGEANRAIAVMRAEGSL